MAVATAAVPVEPPLGACDEIPVVEPVEGVDNQGNHEELSIEVPAENGFIKEESISPSISSKENVDPGTNTKKRGHKKKSKPFWSGKKRKRNPSDAPQVEAPTETIAEIIETKPDLSKRQVGRPSRTRNRKNLELEPGQRPITMMLTHAKSVSPAANQTLKTTEEKKSEESDEKGSAKKPKVEVEGEFTVESILKKQFLNGQILYLIKWKGWSDDSNTWEPADHLDGCKKMLEKFEKDWAEKQKMPPPPSRRRKVHRRKLSEDLIEDDEEKLKKTQNHMKAYGVNTEWPHTKEPESVEGVINVDGILTYVVKKSSRSKSKCLDSTNAVLVHASGFREAYPALVIQFYEKRLLWCEDAKDSEEQANIVAVMSHWQNKKESGFGKEISDYIENEIASGIVKEEDAGMLDGQQEDQVPSNVATASEMQQDLETQALKTEDLNESFENETTDAEEDESSMDLDLETQIIKEDLVDENDCLMKTKTDCDKFGLPKDTCDKETDSSSDKLIYEGDGDSDEEMCED